MSDKLPIDAVLPELVQAVRHGSGAVLRAPTGAGKTTRVPPALLDAGVAADRSIVMLEPRRLAAQTAARRMAAERGGRLGDEVGYSIRFERRTSANTRIHVVTEAIFVRMLQDDPFLESVAIVIFDEFHERNLASDLALAMVRRVQRDARSDLKVVVMSATLDPAPIARYLDVPVIESHGRQFPVDVRYLPQSPTGPIARIAAAGVAEVLDCTRGDVLVFLPGVAEIRRTRSELESLAATENLLICNLYADLPIPEQDLALRPGDRRKVILSTNVAETSVTIEGVTAVVDSGLARISKFDPALGLNRLEVTRISRASAAQRTGRAGRTLPGVCLRLWTEREQRGMIEAEAPEVRRLDVSDAVLQVVAWGEPDVRSFPWFEPPTEHSLEHAELLLRRLGALDARGITPIGRQMVQIPAQPRLARMLIEGESLGVAEPVAIAAALLAERDPFRRPRERSESTRSSDSDVLDRVQAIEGFERMKRTQSEVGELDRGAALHVLRARDQLLRSVRGKSQPGPVHADRDEGVLRALLAAFPDRVARRRERNSRRGVMVGGRGVRLADQSALRESSLFVCVDAEEIGQAESLVRLASGIQREWLRADRVTVRVECEFDAARERVIAWRRTYYEDLVIEEANTDASAEEAARLLADAANQLDPNAFFRDESIAQFVVRVNCLRQWMPELQLPELSPSVWQDLLPQLCEGRRSFAELRTAPVLDFLKGMLSYAQLQTLDREVPERIAVPSGSRIPVQYELGRPPVIAVRIQELFGLRATPRIAGGRVGVLLHLLAPNMRPQQVTDDLASFWSRTYPIVRKELSRRYPKHAWPEDPLSATPERRPQRRTGSK